MPSTVHLTTAQALVKFLQVQFSELDGESRRLIAGVFGIFGHGNVAGMGQALFEYGEDLPYYQPCNEQSMVHTATAFAKANRRLATMACTSSIGPGATNMVTGAATATLNRLPVLLLPGDYFATRRSGPVLQQLEHPVCGDVSVNDCFRPVSRYFDRIQRPEQLLTALPEAMRVLTDPAETGAVTLALPQDVQTHAYDYPANFFQKKVWQIERRLPSPVRIAEAVRLLRQARRPVLIAGGGIHYSGAWEELQAFVETCGIAVGETSAGKGAIRNACPLLLGGAGVTGTPAAARILSHADLVIAAGTRLTDFTTGSHSAFQHPEVRFINVNISGHDAYKEGALPIQADAREALRALCDATRAAGIRPNAAYVQEVQLAQAEWNRTVHEQIYQQVPGEAMSQGQIIGALNSAAQSGDTVLTAAGSPPGDLLRLWDATGGRTCHLEFGNSCMGYELPAALGVRMAQPRNEVYVFIGDGTYLMNPTEIVTAVQENLKITVVILENHGYQCISALQLDRAGHDFGNEFRCRDPKTNRLEADYVRIDFAQNAASMGARTWKVRTIEELCRALREAREETRCCAIVAEVEPHRMVPSSGMWWDVEVASASQNDRTKVLRARFEENRKKLQRFYY